MTGKADFQPDEWELVLEGPTFAGTMAATAQGRRDVREAFALARAYTEARSSTARASCSTSSRRRSRRSSATTRPRRCTSRACRA